VKSAFTFPPPTTIAAKNPTNIILIFSQFNNFMFHLPFFEISVNIAFINLPM